MRIWTSWLVVVTVVVSVSTAAHAGWHEFWAEFEQHRRRVETWPEPFVIPDREAVREPFRTMADNGWKQQNTLNDECFAKEDQELTHAGKIKLRQMLHEFPPHRRQIFVLEGQTQEVTAARVASAYKCLAEIAPDQQPCSVNTTRIPGPVGAGWYVQGVNRAAASNKARLYPGSSSGTANSSGSTLNSAAPLPPSTTVGPSSGQ